MTEPKTPQQEIAGWRLALISFVGMGACALCGWATFTAPAVSIGLGAFWADLGSGAQACLTLGGVGLAALGVGGGVALARDRRALPDTYYVAVLPSARPMVDIERID